MAIRDLVEIVKEESHIIVGMYKGGISINDIALTYQVGTSIIKEILIKAGIDIGECRE